MKKLFFVLTMVFGLNQVQASVLPDDWNDLVLGIPVQESDLGVFIETSRFEGADFHWFEKTIFNQGEKVVCQYAVLAEKPHYLADGLTSCK